MEENKLAIQNELTNEEIKNLIYTIRGKQVIIDNELDYTIMKQKE